MSEFIGRNIQYPSAALDANIHGTVVIKLHIDHKGSVTKTTLIAGIGAGCDEEALRVSSLLVFSTPKTPHGGRVFYAKTINIHFSSPFFPSNNNTRVIDELSQKQPTHSQTLEQNSSDDPNSSYTKIQNP